MDPNSQEPSQQPVPSTTTPPVSPGFANTQPTPPQPNMSQSAPPPPPSRTPHLPISPQETEININSTPKSGRNVLITMLSILVLAIIILVTLWLFIQNSSKKKIDTNIINKSDTNSQSDKKNPIQSGIPTLAPEELKKRYGDVVCYRFTNLEEALKAPKITCSLDLSGNDLNDLSDDINLFTNLSSLDLSNNNFTEFPKPLISSTKIQSIDLSNNKIQSLPNDVYKNRILKSLKLSGNPISKENKKIIKEKLKEKVEF